MSRSSLRLRRAVPITVDEGRSLPFTVRTTAPTVGEALRQAEITIYLGDRVEPSLGSGVTAGLRVIIGRSTPIAVQADGTRHKTRVQARTVGDALTDLGIVAAGLDTIEPPLDTLLFPDIEIKVTRVREEIEVEEEIEPYETVFQGNADLAIDVQEVTEPGAEGITRQRYRVRYEDGELVARTLEDDWLAQAPAYAHPLLWPEDRAADGRRRRADALPTGEESGCWPQATRRPRQAATAPAPATCCAPALSPSIPA